MLKRIESRAIMLGWMKAGSTINYLLGKELTSVSLTFFTYKMGVTIVPTPHEVVIKLKKLVSIKVLRFVK